MKIQCATHLKVAIAKHKRRTHLTYAIINVSFSAHTKIRSRQKFLPIYMFSFRSTDDEVSWCSMSFGSLKMNKVTRSSISLSRALYSNFQLTHTAHTLHILNVREKKDGKKICEARTIKLEHIVYPKYPASENEIHLYLRHFYFYRLLLHFACNKYMRTKRTGGTTDKVFGCVCMWDMVPIECSLTLFW